MKNGKLLILIICFFNTCFISTAMAEEKSVDFFEYDQARLLYSKESDRVIYRLALSPYEKRGNRWLPEKYERLKGSLKKLTYELPRSSGEQEVFEFYREQLPKNAEVLYQCEGRNCGESNNWANDHFNIKQLYGLDQYQFYGTYKIGEEQVVTLYSVRRGNRRVYMQIDILTLVDTDK